MSVVELKPVQQWSVDREMTKSTAPDINQLLLAANAEPEKERYACAGDYADSVHALRQKGFTWKEVTAWMESKGANFSQQAIVAGYRTRYAP
ncbi:MAG: hypothetical protein QM813_17120 [Verrucomicrobiota bacterium]